MAPIDYIGKLPDTLFILIISLLPFKESTRTCILAKHWRYIWWASKNIGFDNRLIVNVGDEFVAEESNGVRMRGSFLNLAWSWIESYQHPSLDKFSLTCSTPQNYVDDVTNCITFCMEKRVRILLLDFSDSTWKKMRTSIMLRISICLSMFMVIGLLDL